MNSDFEVWRALYETFDPWKPAQGGQRADRGAWSPVSRLSRELARPLGRKRVLLLGTQGSGKTTELLRLAEERSDRFFVVYVDLWRHMQEQVGDAPGLTRLQPWEAFLVAGLAVHRAGREGLGIRWEPEEEAALLGALDALRGERPKGEPAVDLAKLAGGLLVFVSAVAAIGPAVAGMGVGAAATAVATKAAGATYLSNAVSGLRELATSAKWELPLGRSGSRTVDSQDPAVRRLRDAVNALIARIQTEYKPILLVIDGLDRVTEPADVQRLFVDSALLAEFEASTLLTASLALRRPGVGATVRGWDVRVMFSVPVLDHDHPSDPTRPGPGLAFFRDLVRRRHPEAARRLPEPVVDRLAWASGGLVREFLHLVQSALTEADLRELPAVDLPTADAAVDDRRRTMEGVSLLTTGDIDVCVEVARTHALPDGEAVRALVDGFCLLPYPNETEWWYPHPLLTLVKLRGRIGSPG